MSKLIVGETYSTALLARVDINESSRMFRNYILIRTDLTRRAYSYLTGTTLQVFVDPPKFLYL